MKLSLPHIPGETVLCSDCPIFLGSAWILLSLEEESNMRVQNLCNFYMNMSRYKEDWMLYWWLGSNLNTLVFWVFVFFLAFLVASRMEVYIGKEPRNVSALLSSNCTWQSSQEIPMQTIAVNKPSDNCFNTWGSSEGFQTYTVAPALFWFKNTDQIRVHICTVYYAVAPPIRKGVSIRSSYPDHQINNSFLSLSDKTQDLADTGLV